MRKIPGIEQECDTDIYSGIDRREISTVIAKTYDGHYYHGVFCTKDGLEEGKIKIKKIGIVFDEYQGTPEKNIEERIHWLNQKKFNQF